MNSPKNSVSVIMNSLESELPRSVKLVSHTHEFRALECQAPPRKLSKQAHVKGGKVVGRKPGQGNKVYVCKQL